MALFGIDTSKPASEPLRVLATQRLAGGANPKFWGRYFNGTDDRTYQYGNPSSANEGVFLRKAGIPVLCFARQMWAVSDAYVSSAADHAKKNMQGVVAAFGAQYLLDHNIVPRLYLDLEPEGGHPEHVMAQAYYTNWSAAIVAGLTVRGHTIKFSPAGYLNLGDNGQSFLALNAARAAGAVCDGFWPAHYVHENRAGGPPEDTTPANENKPPPMSDQMAWSDAPPAHDPFPPGQPDQHIPKIGWQYFGDYPKPDGDVDFNIVNRAHEAAVMAGTVMPPPP
jgi:hypothetical protein